MKQSSIEYNEKLLIELWYKRNPSHEANSDSGEDMFWKTAFMVFEDYLNEINKPKEAFLDLVSNEVSQSCNKCEYFNVNNHPECFFCKVIHSNAHHSYFKPKVNEG